MTAISDNQTVFTQYFKMCITELPQADFLICPFFFFNLDGLAEHYCLCASTKADAFLSTLKNPAQVRFKNLNPCSVQTLFSLGYLILKILPHILNFACTDGEAKSTELKFLWKHVVF